MFVEMKNFFSSLNFLDSYIDSSGYDVLVFQAEGIQQFTILEFTVAKSSNALKIIDFRNINIDGYQSEIIYQYAVSVYEASLDNMPIEEYVNEIMQLVKDRKYQDAKKIYDEIPEVVKKDNIALDMSYLSIIQYTNFEEYSKIIEKQITQIKHKPTQLVQRYFINIAKNNFEEALNNIEELSVLYPKASVFPHQLGHIYYRLKLYDEAIKYYLKSIELEPEILIYKNSLSTMYLEKGQYSKAIDIYNELLNENYIELKATDDFVKEYFPEFQQSKEYQDWKMSVEETSSGSL
jgi:tetratricopeptide (TPR) repeat protein